MNREELAALNRANLEKMDALGITTLEGVEEHEVARLEGEYAAHPKGVSLAEKLYLLQGLDKRGELPPSASRLARLLGK